MGSNAVSHEGRLVAWQMYSLDSCDVTAPKTSPPEREKKKTFISLASSNLLLPLAPCPPLGQLTPFYNQLPYPTSSQLSRGQTPRLVL